MRVCRDSHHVIGPCFFFAMSRASDPSAHPTDPPSSRPPPFRVKAAVKLVPKFSESDVETFLISFEKVAELNNFPPDKYMQLSCRPILPGKLWKFLPSFLLRNVGIILLLKLLCYKRIPLFPKSIGNGSGTSVSFILRPILSMLSVWVPSLLDS